MTQAHSKPAQPGNLLAAIPAHLPDELVDVLLQHKGLRIERIVSRGHCSADGFWYEQTEHEWVMLLQGEAILRFEEGDKQVRLSSGDYLNIAAGCRHRVEQTSTEPEAVWLAIFFAE